MLFLPESPRFLLLKGREAEARQALGRLLTLPAESPEVEEGCLLISSALKLEQEASSGSWADCFSNNENRHGFRTWTGILLQAMQQLTGINFIFYYGTTFFKQAGIQTDTAFALGLITSALQMIFVMLSWILTTYFGRRSIYLWGSAANTILLIALGVAASTGPSTEAAKQAASFAQASLGLIVSVLFTLGPVSQENSKKSQKIPKPPQTLPRHPPSFYMVTER